LRISADANNATAVFIQYYNSSTLKSTGKKEIGTEKNKWRMENIQGNYVVISRKQSLL